MHLVSRCKQVGVVAVDTLVDRKHWRKRWVLQRKSGSRKVWGASANQRNRPPSAPQLQESAFAVAPGRRGQLGGESYVQSPAAGTASPHIELLQRENQELLLIRRLPGIKKDTGAGATNGVQPNQACRRQSRLIPIQAGLWSTCQLR